MTSSASRLSSLLKSTISGTFFAHLPPSHQLIFLTKVILPLIDAYGERIKSSLDAFDTLSGLFGRAIPGSMTGSNSTSASAGSELTSGPEGVSKLVKAWASARYVQRLIKRWKEELVWIELWEYVKERRGMVSSDLGYLDLVPDSEGLEEEEGEGSVFEIVLGKYERLWKRAEEMVVRQVGAEISGGLKEYFAG
jgi:hypothetical protein